ncbi:MAG: hypothetical protein V1889_00600 [archaeon]
MENKRGQQMTLSTIIAIVLGIVVLIFLIYGFSTGWSNLWSKVTGSVSGSNVEDKIKDCETDCSLGERTSYCFENKELRFFDSAGKVVKVSGTCVNFSSDSFVVDGKVSAGQIKGMGFESCASIKC